MPGYRTNQDLEALARRSTPHPEVPGQGRASKDEAPLLLFRVHFETGAIIKIRATNPAEARKKATAICDGFIKRVKLDRSGDHG